MSTNTLLLKEKIIIGTSSWGSKISFDFSLKLGEKLIRLGIKRFDTAPAYGSGYSIYILNLLAKKNKIIVNNKIGQKYQFSHKEILKRIYRFKNFYYFKKAFVNDSVYSNKEQFFWEKKFLFKKIQKILNEFKILNSDVFFLHDPQENIINKNFLISINHFLKKNNCSFGISTNNISLLEKIIKLQYPLIIQTSYLNYMYLSNKYNLKNFKFQIYSIIKNYNFQSLKKQKKPLTSILNKYLNNKNISFIIGINSLKSLNKLKNEI